MNPEDFKEVIKECLYDKRFKLIFHNAKFDLSVYRTFLGQPIPDPYWDTMICGNLLNQNEEHRT